MPYLILLLPQSKNLKIVLLPPSEDKFPHDESVFDRWYQQSK